MVVSTPTRELFPADVVISGERIAAVATPGEYPSGQAEEVDLGGRFVAPGLIDPHVHIESSNLTLTELARAIVPRGVLSLCEDAHEIANVLGLPGIELLVSEGAALPAQPAAARAGTRARTACRISRRPATPWTSKPRSSCSTVRMRSASAATSTRRCCSALTRTSWRRSRRRSLGGRPSVASCPGSRADCWTRRSSRGIEDTHVAESVEEVMEQLRRGLRVLPDAPHRPAPRRGVAGDRRRDQGARAWTPATWSCAATTSTRTSSSARGISTIESDWRCRPASTRSRPSRWRRSTPPSTFAWIAIWVRWRRASWPTSWCSTTSRRSRCPRSSTAGGSSREAGRLIDEPRGFTYPAWSRDTIRLAAPVGADDLALHADGTASAGGTATCARGGLRRAEDHAHRASCGWKAGSSNPTPSADIASIAVIERHRQSGAIGRGFVSGLGIRGGAVACTVNHDSHNLVRRR